MNRLLNWALNALPFVACLLGGSIFLLHLMEWLDIGYKMPGDQELYVWSFPVYAVCAMITLLFAVTYSYHRALHWKKSTPALVLVFQSLLWFLYLPWFAAKCSSKDVQFAQVARVVGEIWLEWYKKMYDKLLLARSTKPAKPVDTSEIYDDGEPHKDHTLH